MNTDLEIQTYKLLGLASWIEPGNKRMRASTTPFRVLHSIYLLTLTNHSKGREETYPCKELIAKVAGCGRRQVTDFITSDACEEFCHVIREYDKVNKKFMPNRYVLKDWVIQLFKLFWRSGMMKNFKNNYRSWLSTFKKRIYKWLVPLAQKGKTLKEIWDSVVNKLSTKKGLKGAAGPPLKGAGINPTGNKDLRENEDTRDPISAGVNQAVGILKNRFHFREGDIYHFVFREKLGTTVRCMRELLYRIDKLGWIPKNPVKALQALVNRTKRGLWKY